MSELEKLLDISQLHGQQFEDGLAQGKYNTVYYHLDIVQSQSHPPIPQEIQNEPLIAIRNEEMSSCTRECQVTNKKMTSKDKKSTCKTGIKKQTIKKKAKSSTFTISHPDSISKERALSEFWMQSKVEEYKQLSWLPKIDWQGLDSNSSSGYVVSTERKSWFSMTSIRHQPKNSEQTSSPSFKFTVANGTGDEGTKIPSKIKKSWKLRLFPTKQQKMILEKWAGCSRFTYNNTLACLNNRKDKCRRWMNLRNRFVTAKSRKKKVNTFFNNKKWLLDCPKSIRLSAVKEATKNRKTCFTNLSRGNIGKFWIQYKSKKKEKLSGWSIGVEKNNVFKTADKLEIFPKILGDVLYGRKKQLHKLIQCKHPAADPRIQKDRFGDYYLIVVVEVKTKQPPIVHKSAKSYDPGCNIYATRYDPTGQVDMIGKGCNDTILEMLYHLDDLISLKDHSDGIGIDSKELRKKIIRVRKKIYYYKKELHHQVNNLVVKGSTLILYPKLDTLKLTLKENRQLRTKTVRQMLSLGHCEAYEQLKIKCFEHGCELLDVSEAYTTMTCPCCGSLSKCNNARIFNCKCGFKAERDMNGSENILIRSLG